MTIFFTRKHDDSIVMSTSVSSKREEALAALPTAGPREMAILRKKFQSLPDGTLKMTTALRTYLDTVVRQNKAGSVTNDSALFVKITTEERRMLDDVVSWSIVVEARAVSMAEMIRALIEDAKLQSTVLRAYRSPPPQRAVGTLQFYVQITSAQHKSLEVFADRLADVAKRGVSLTETILALARWRLKQLSAE